MVDSIMCSILYTHDGSKGGPGINSAEGERFLEAEDKRMETDWKLHFYINSRIKMKNFKK